MTFPAYPTILQLTITIGHGAETLWWEAVKTTRLPEIPVRGRTLMLGHVPREVVPDTPILAEYSEGPLWDVSKKAYRVPLQLSAAFSACNEEDRTQLLEILRKNRWTVTDRWNVNKDRTPNAPEDDR